MLSYQQKKNLSYLAPVQLHCLFRNLGSGQESLLGCLRSKSVEQLASFDLHSVTPSFLTSMGPSRDGVLIPKDFEGAGPGTVSQAPSVIDVKFVVSSCRQKSHATMCTLRGVRSVVMFCNACSTYCRADTAAIVHLITGTSKRKQKKTSRVTTERTPQSDTNRFDHRETLLSPRTSGQ